MISKITQLYSKYQFFQDLYSFTTSEQSERSFYEREKYFCMYMVAVSGNLPRPASARTVSNRPDRPIIVSLISRRLGQPL